MGAVDIFFLLVLFTSVVVGIWRGLVFEVLSVLGWVAAFFVAQWYAAPAANWLPLTNTAEPLRYAAGFVVVFVVVAFAAGFVSWVVKKLIEKAGLRPVDRVLGGVFGLLRGSLALLAVALVVGMTPLKENQAWQTSVGAPWLAGGLQAIKGFMPDSLAQYFP
jgi:membrane protein required for colicin V production